MRNILYSLLLVICAAPFAGAAGIDSFKEVTALTLEEARGGMVANLKGVATFVRRDGFVLAPSEKRDQSAVFVVHPRGNDASLAINEGDKLMVDGRTCVWENIPAIEAKAVTRTGTTELAEPRTAKWQDVRKGWRNLRRARQYGTVVAIDFEFGNDGACQTLLTLHYWIYDIRVQVAGEVTGDAARVGSEIEVVGITRNIIDENSDVISSFIEVSSPGNVRFIASGSLNKETVILVALTSVASCAALVLLVVWLRGVARSRRMAIIAAERRRMAADLHDTIEQHLAAVRILISIALGEDGVTGAAAETLAKAADTLSRAKLEVRDAVLNLRSEGLMERSLKEEIELFAANMNKAGAVKVQCTVDDLEENLAAYAHADLMMILSEAATNAIKHGKARHIRISGDKTKLRIANDGASFDPETALGPEAGHYGLSGMRERAARQGWKISFVRDGNWICVEVDL